MTASVTSKLKIKDVAERTGVAAATIRMWEQRYGFPTPSRTPSGYRLYTQTDIEAIRTVLALRRRGLSIAAAVDRARMSIGAGESVDEVVTDLERPSIYAAVTSVDATAHPRVLRRQTLAAMSHAIEDELLSRGVKGVVIGAFQREPFYERVAHRYEQIAMRSDATIVFADFPSVVAIDAEPTRIPIAHTDALGNEWAVVVDSPRLLRLPARLGATEPVCRWRPHVRSAAPLDPRAARRACQIAAELTRRQDPTTADALATLLEGRPLATEPPASALTSLTNRMVAYLDGGGSTTT